MLLGQIQLLSSSQITLDTRHHHLHTGPCGIITIRDHRCPGPNSPPAPPNIIMLNELEFAYTPVRDKVRDLREYL